jgi:hypothetical protein
MKEFEVRVHKSDGTIETLKDVKRIVVDVEKTSGITAMNILDPDYTELRERIEKLENKKNIFERIFKK